MNQPVHSTMTLLSSVVSAALTVGISMHVQQTPDHTAYLPDRRQVPGEVIAGVSLADVQQPNYSATIRHVTQSMKHAVANRDGIPIETLGHYEIDHKIPCALGGAQTLKNLWAQPLHGAFGAKVKDRLEVRMLAMVRRGEISLPAAQRAFERDWVAAYKKHLGKPQALSLEELEGEGNPAD